MNISFKAAPSVILWVCILGGGGFLAGFLGPIVFVPEANQGPLVGIFMTGPLGFAMGILLWAASALLRLQAKYRWIVLFGSTVILVLTTLCFVQPQPALRGEVMEVQVERCEPPEAVADDVVRYWSQRIKTVTWASPRVRWQESMREALTRDGGSILSVRPIRTRQIREHRKLWNRGKLFGTPWQTMTGNETYYRRLGDCSSFPPDAPVTFFIEHNLSALSGSSKQWPPLEVKDFIHLKTLSDVPPEFSDVP